MTTEIILTAITSDNKYVFINTNSLKDNLQLTNATIFNRLFGLIHDNKNDTWEPKHMEKDISGNILLLKNLNIRQSDWILFTAYIKHGIPPYFYTMKFNGFSKESIIKKVESINETCNKFGGIPCFDEFYEKFILSDAIKKKNYYNPFEPKEDTKKKYDWVLVYYNQPGEMTNIRSQGWSCIKNVQGSDSNISYTWWRKLKHLT